MKYVKPDVFVTKFSANAFIASCEVTTYNKPVTVQCIITQHETVFSAGVDGCNYTSESLVSFGGGYFRSSMDAVNAFSDGKVTPGEYSTNQKGQYNYYLKNGDYLVWTSGSGKKKTYHVGPVGPAETGSIKNHS